MLTLIIGPSCSGKTFYSRAFKTLGLPALDAEDDLNLPQWYNGATNSLVADPPTHRDAEWYKTHHFLIPRERMAQVLKERPNIILFAHCWNIMELTNLFDNTFLLSLPADELERRLASERPDHHTHAPHQIAFFKERHTERRAQARQQGIPLLDATQSPETLYEQLQKTEGRRVTGRPYVSYS